MKKLGIVLAIVLVIVAILLGVGWWVDGKAQRMAEDEAARRVVEVLPGTRKAEVDIDSFPFLVDVLVRGRIRHLHVLLHDVREAGISVEQVELDVDDIAIDEDLLLDQQKLAVTGIGGATLVVLLTADAVAKVVGQPVVFDGDVAKVEVGGVRYEAEVTVRGRRVSVAPKADGLPAEYAAYVRPLVFDMPSADVLPCTPTVVIARSRLRLGCSVDALPDAVRRALAQR